MRVTVRGTWPGRVEIRRGWARADARPWNVDTRAAHLRLVRGSAAFLAAAAEWALALDVGAVLTSPVLGSPRVWEQAGFSPAIDLLLMRRPAAPGPAPLHQVERLGPEERPAVLAVDAAAFAPFWRVDAAGLDEAVTATPQAVILGTRDAGALLTGFAVVGVAGRTGYLQRLAVHPDAQGGGLGRSLTRAAATWSRARGADDLLLNTQPGNRAALAMYASEGFDVVAERLAVYGRPVEMARDLAAG